MSVGPTTHQSKISTRQFTGDLGSLFARHRIIPGSVCAFANFESRFALSESFRNQLFMLCTAISHMSEVDQTGEQLLELMTCALNSTEASADRAALPEWVRVEFRDGYDAWNARDLSKVDAWQISPQHAKLKPLAPPAGVERGQSEVETSKEGTLHAPIDIETRSRALKPQAVVKEHLEHLTPDALATLLKQMEFRTERLKPHIRPPVVVAPERKQFPVAATEQTPPQTSRSIEMNDQAFLARHPYLVPEGRFVPAAARTLQLAPSSLGLKWDGRVAAANNATAALSPWLVEAAETTIRPRDERPGSANKSAGRFQVRLGMAIRGLAASGILAMLAAGLAGMVLYPSAVATYFDQSSGYGLHAQKSVGVTRIADNPRSLANAPANGTKRSSTASSHRANGLH